MLIRRSRLRRVLTSRWLLGYVLLLALSHAFITVFPRTKPVGGASPSVAHQGEWVEIPQLTGSGSPARGTTSIEFRRWRASVEGRAVPVLLIHGSPSRGAADFDRLGPELAQAGYDAIALSLPGFGASSRWAPDYGIEANARSVLAVMDALGIERAHLLGWSLGGGSAVHAARIAPERIVSLALMSSIGVQEAEGSGSYFFERWKYRLGYGALVVLPEAIPHFGLLGPRHFRYAFIRNFLDTDLRPMRAIMEQLETPTLILHGRRDFLVPDWAAEEHHRLIGPSRLVVYDAGHFLPRAEGDEQRAMVHDIAAFWRHHEQPGAITRRGAAIFSPYTDGPARLGKFNITRETPWWVIVIVIALLTFISEDLTTIAVGLLVSQQQLDIGVALFGCFTGIILGDLGLWALGRFLGRRILRWPLIRSRVSESSLEYWAEMFERHTAKAVFLSRCLPGTRAPTYIAAGILARRTHKFLLWVAVAVLLWTPFLLILSMLIGPRLLELFRTVLHGPWAIAASFIVLFILIRLLSYESTAIGRQKLKADLARTRLVEFWPPWLFYLPFVPYLFWLAIRYGPMSFTCANPGIANGGGVVGESKSAILRGLSKAGAPILPFRLIKTGDSPETRTRRAIGAIHDDPWLGGYPIILKPDTSQRGHGLKLARSDQDVYEYFNSMTRDAIIQAFDPGPEEIGLLWSRRPGEGDATDEAPGEVFSVTRKSFPAIVGDGKHTLEELIWRHPRYRMQARVFLKRFADEQRRVLENGERFPLGIAGNHCQGSMFRDGSDLITSELAKRIDEIAQAYRDESSGRRVDFGRFDLRYADENELKRGRGFTIIELNGTMSESTNIYDPDRSLVWRYGVLFRQWKRLYAIGAQRRREGVRPMGPRPLLRALREHYRGRPGSSVSD